jgi:hypothetical protein
MTSSRRLSPTALALAVTACASIDVRTVTNPHADLVSLRTFNVMSQPPARAPDAQSADDPMLVNSISNRALRADLVKAFQDRGYVLADHPDFSVAFYASAKQKLDVSTWDYGYPYYPYWWGGWGPGWDPTAAQTTQYTQGTVVVDVIDAQNHELLWRGAGVSKVSDDEQQYEQDLWKTVVTILETFPRAQPDT